jgi:hypothetical protein
LLQRALEVELGRQLAGRDLLLSNGEPALGVLCLALAIIGSDVNLLLVPAPVNLPLGSVLADLAFDHDDASDCVRHRAHAEKAPPPASRSRVFARTLRPTEFTDDRANDGMKRDRVTDSDV